MTGEGQIFHIMSVVTEYSAGLLYTSVAGCEYKQVSCWVVNKC